MTKIEIRELPERIAEAMDQVRSGDEVILTEGESRALGSSPWASRRGE